MNFAIIVAQIATEAAHSPINILFGMVGSLSAAIVALYADCRADRRKLWTYVMSHETKLAAKK